MKKLLWFPIIVVLAVFIFFLSDYVNSRASLKKIEKQYREYKAISETTIMFKNKEIEEKWKRIDELNSAIDSANTVIAGLEGKIEDKDKELIEARKSWGTLSLECQEKLREVDSIWSQKFSLAQSNIKELEEKCGLQELKISELYGIIDSKNDIISEKENQITACEKVSAEISMLYAREKRASRLKSYTMAGIGIAGFLLGRI